VSSTYLTTNLIESLLAYKYKVNVLAPTPSRGIMSSSSKVYSIQKNYSNSFSVTRIPLFKEPRSNFFRFVRYTLFGIAVFFRSLFLKYDIIFTFSTPPSIGLFCSLSSIIKKKKFIYCIQDLFPESLKIIGIDNNNFIYKVGEAIEKYSLKKTTHLITISNEIKNRLESKKWNLPFINVIENWIDFKNIHPTNKSNNPLFKKYSLKISDFNIVYSGNIGLSQNFEMLINVAEKLKDEHSIKFIFFGNGSFKVKLIGLKESKSLSNVLIFDPETEENIKYVYGMANLSLVSSKSGVSSHSLPNKAFNIMACKTPLLISFDKNSKLWELVKKTNAGFCVEPNDIDGITNLILRIHNRNSDLISRGTNGYNFVKKHLDKNKQIEMYMKLFRN
jgi:glycosyltransferase involved in cell wall biosynthesis